MAVVGSSVVCMCTTDDGGGIDDDVGVVDDDGGCRRPGHWHISRKSSPPRFSTSVCQCPVPPIR